MSAAEPAVTATGDDNEPTLSAATAFAAGADPESFDGLRNRIRAKAVDNITALTNQSVIDAVDNWFKTHIEPVYGKGVTVVEGVERDTPMWLVHMTPQYLRDRLTALEKDIMARIAGKAATLI